MKREQNTKLVIGIVLLVSFLVVLVAIFLPLFGGDNALNALDNLYNSISKGSAYYVPKVLQQIESHPATAVNLSLDYKQAEVGARAAVSAREGRRDGRGRRHRDPGAGRPALDPQGVRGRRRLRLPRPRRRASRHATGSRPSPRSTPGGRPCPRSSGT